MKEDVFNKELETIIDEATEYVMPIFLTTYSANYSDWMEYNNMTESLHNIIERDIARRTDYKYSWNTISFLHSAVYGNVIDRCLKIFYA
ncbi:MAG: hypothetical protein J6T10_00415 [Methanobrevibacter sp.]|nr:hypothetical protein [Methanobrevibacter sp.]